MLHRSFLVPVFCTVLCTLCVPLSVAGSTLGTTTPCVDDVPLHTSLIGVDPELGKTLQQIDRNTVPAPQSGPLHDPQGGKLGARTEQGLPLPSDAPFSVTFILRDDPLFTCTKVGQKVMNFDSITTNTCTAEDVLTAEKRQRIVQVADSVKQQVAQMFYPLKTASESNKVKLHVKVAKCNIRELEEPFTFDFPANGYEADLVVYLVSSPITYVQNTPHALNVHALGFPCYFAPNSHRPLVGVINYAPAQIDAVSQEYTEKVFLHEFVHVLGWVPGLALPVDGRADQTILWNEWVWLLEGYYALKKRVHNAVFTPKYRGLSQPVEIPTATIPLQQTVLASPHVKALARQHYNCSTLAGVEVEDHTYGLALPTFFSTHFEKRVLSGEVMNARVERGAVLSYFTVGVLLDTGFYNLSAGFRAFLAEGNIFATTTTHVPHKPRSFLLYSDIQYGKLAGCPLHDLPCGLWHQLQETSVVKTYSCLERFARHLNVSRYVGHGDCGRNGTECLAGCNTDYFHPSSLAFCGGESRLHNDTTLNTKMTTNLGILTPPEYLDARMYSNVTYRVEDDPVKYKDPKSRNSFYSFPSTFDGLAAAQAHSGCDALMDYCYVWKEEASCLTTTTVFPPSLPTPTENCQREKCGSYTEMSPSSFCYLSDLHQRWSTPHTLPSGRCLPSECFRSIFNTTALRIKIGGENVVCYKKNDVVGPGYTQSGGRGKRFFTFYPTAVSELLGQVVCPDPDIACRRRRILSAAELVFTPVNTSSPMVATTTPSVEPPLVKVSRVTVNGVLPCKDMRLQEGPCEMIVFGGMGLTFRIQGGPFEGTDLWVGVGRDRACDWSGAVRFTANFSEQNNALRYEGMVPHWALPVGAGRADSMSFCVKHRNTLISSTMLRDIRISVHPPGAFSAKRTFHSGTLLLDVAPTEVVKFGSPLVLLLDWEAQQAQLHGNHTLYFVYKVRPFFTEAFFDGGAVAYPLGEVGSALRVFPDVIPPGYEGQLVFYAEFFYHDGQRLSSLFLMQEFRMRVSGFTRFFSDHLAGRSGSMLDPFTEASLALQAYVGNGIARIENSIVTGHTYSLLYSLINAVKECRSAVDSSYDMRDSVSAEYAVVAEKERGVFVDVIEPALLANISHAVAMLGRKAMDTQVVAKADALNAGVPPDVLLRFPANAVFSLSFALEKSPLLSVALPLMNAIEVLTLRVNSQLLQANSRVLSYYDPATIGAQMSRATDNMLTVLLHLSSRGGAVPDLVHTMFVKMQTQIDRMIRLISTASILQLEYALENAAYNVLFGPDAVARDLKQAFVTNASRSFVTRLFRSREISLGVSTFVTFDEVNDFLRSFGVHIKEAVQSRSADVQGSVVFRNALSGSAVGVLSRRVYSSDTATQRLLHKNKRTSESLHSDVTWVRLGTRPTHNTVTVTTQPALQMTLSFHVDLSKLQFPSATSCKCTKLPCMGDVDVARYVLKRRKTSDDWEDVHTTAISIEGFPAFYSDEQGVITNVPRGADDAFLQDTQYCHSFGEWQRKTSFGAFMDAMHFGEVSDEEAALHPDAAQGSNMHARGHQLRELFLHEQGALLHGSDLIVANPHGTYRTAHSPAHAVDGDTTTSWVDFSASHLLFKKRSAALFTLDAYQLFAETRHLYRTPVEWTLEVSNDSRIEAALDGNASAADQAKWHPISSVTQDVSREFAYTSAKVLEKGSDFAFPKMPVTPISGTYLRYRVGKVRGTEVSFTVDTSFDLHDFVFQKDRAGVSRVTTLVDYFHSVDYAVFLRTTAAPQEVALLDTSLFSLDNIFNDISVEGRFIIRGFIACFGFYVVVLILVFWFDARDDMAAETELKLKRKMQQEAAAVALRADKKRRKAEAKKAAARASQPRSKPSDAAYPVPPPPDIRRSLRNSTARRMSASLGMLPVGAMGVPHPLTQDGARSRSHSGNMVDVAGLQHNRMGSFAAARRASLYEEALPTDALHHPPLDADGEPTERTRHALTVVASSVASFLAVGVRERHCLLSVLYREALESRSRPAVLVGFMNYVVTAFFFAILFFARDNEGQREDTRIMALFFCALCSAGTAAPVVRAGQAIFERSSESAQMAEFVEHKEDAHIDNPLIGELTVSVPCCRDLPATTAAATTDTLYTVEWENKRYTSTIRHNTLDPEWSTHFESISFPVRKVAGESVKISVYAVYNEDVKQTEPVAFVNICLESVLEGLTAHTQRVLERTRSANYNYSSDNWFALPLEGTPEEIVPFGRVPRVRAGLHLRMYRKPLVVVPKAYKTHLDGDAGCFFDEAAARCALKRTLTPERLSALRASVRSGERIECNTGISGVVVEGRFSFAKVRERVLGAGGTISCGGTRVQRRKLKWAEDHFTTIGDVEYIDTTDGRVAKDMSTFEKAALDNPSDDELDVGASRESSLNDVRYTPTVQNPGLYARITQRPKRLLAAFGTILATFIIALPIASARIPEKRNTFLGIGLLLVMASVLISVLWHRGRGCLFALISASVLVLSAFFEHSPWLLGCGSVFIASLSSLGPLHWIVVPIIFAIMFNTTTAGVLLVVSNPPFDIVATHCGVLTGVWGMLFLAFRVKFGHVYAYAPYGIFGAIFSASFLMVLGHVEWEGKEKVAKNVSTRFPMMFFVLYCLCLVLVHKLLRGYILPVVVAPKWRAVSLAGSLVYQVLMLLFCLSYVSDASTDNSAYPILNAMLFCIWQHVFLTDFAFTFVTEYSSDLLGRAMRASCGPHIEALLEGAWITKLLLASE